MSVRDPLSASADLNSLFLPDDAGDDPFAEHVADPEILGSEPAAENDAPRTAEPEIQAVDAIAAVEENAPDGSHVPKNLNWMDVMAEFDAMTRTMALASGRRDSLIERERARVLEVSEAKGRGDFKDEIEDVLGKLQQEAHERSVGSFERMLTAIAQDVQPISPITIKLELTTERNMPALNIEGEVRRPAKEGEKFEDYVKPEELTSGGLANVVSTGLRFITLARSNNRRFLVLDEADCWIEPKDIQNFFNVVNQLSRDAGIQTLIITHHDLSAFEDDFRIYRIHEIESKDQWKHRTPELVSAGRMEKTELQHDVISFVEAKNFEAYTHAHIDLAPGVTAITGMNRGSKSAWARMLRAAFLGADSDGIIRHGQTATKVAVGFSDGRVLEYNRRKKGTPKADFIMHTPDSWEFARNNPLWSKDPNAPKPYHNSPVAKVPQWVPAETGVGLIDDVNVQLWGQFTPVFMLGESASPSKRASLLSIGRESGYLFAMNEINKENISNDNKLIRDGEKEIFSLRANLTHYEGFPELQATVDALTAQLHALVLEDRWLAVGSSIMEELQQNRIENEYLSKWKGLEQILPRTPELSATAELSDWLDRVKEAKDMQSCRTEVEVPAQPEIAVTGGLEHLLAELALAKKDAQLQGKIPVRPEFPEIFATTTLKDLCDQLGVARIDKERTLVEMPTMALIKRTEKLEQWMVNLKQSNVDRMLPRIAMPVMPDVSNTQSLSDILSEANRIASFLEQFQKQSIGLRHQFQAVQQILEKASKALGFDAFELPGDVANALAEGAVISFEPGGNGDKVVAYFETIKEQIQVAARKGYVHAMEKNLELPGGFLEQTLQAPEAALTTTKRSPRP